MTAISVTVTLAMTTTTNTTTTIIIVLLLESPARKESYYLLIESKLMMPTKIDYTNLKSSFNEYSHSTTTCVNNIAILSNTIY